MRHWIVFALAGLAAAQTQLRPLREARILEPPGLADYVRDRKALVALGKIFFWEMQAGSDGVTACATCHFHAGADHRPRNMLSEPDGAFPVNAELSSLSFPFRQLSDPLNKNSAVLRDTPMRVGSMGTIRRIFDGIVPGQAAELGHDEPDKPEFMKGGLQVRRVTARNTPSVFNTVFYARNFWDGRAATVFNGFNPSGNDAETPGVLESVDGVLRRKQIRIDLASLASQAAGPALDHLEMSYAGRTWPHLGKKLLSLAPLGLQRVSVNDGVLGDMARAGEPGLQEQFTYRSLIESVFQPRFWESAQRVDGSGELRDDGEFSQAEYNFPLFWGLALQAYQSTLNSDDSPVDRFLSGDAAALSAQQREGLNLFQTTGGCTECHNGPEITAAAWNANRTIRAHAFDRTGVRPAQEDLGSGNGLFKSISLRNVEFTGPYFHNGGQATLEQVVDFYRRAGDFSPVANDLRPFNINSEQKASLVAFLKA
ncbi:MAG: cytochrome c peroxidase [Bryobacteraceae bacterium]